MGKTRRFNKFQSVRGSIIAAGWDDDDRLIAVSIVTDDDDELYIDPYGKGELLLDYVDEYVEVKGVVHNDDGEYCLTVHGFKVLDGDEEEPLASTSSEEEDDEELDEEDVA